jgi:hypothetical protein
LKEKLRHDAEERIKAEKAAQKAAGVKAKGKKDAAAAAAAEAEPAAKKGRAEKKPKPPRSDRSKRPTGGKASTRARQKGRSGD